MQSNCASRLPLLAAQFTLLAVLAVWLAWSGQRALAPRELPALRDAPQAIGAYYDCDFVVSDEQLQRVMAKLRPRNEGPDTKINHVDHALRFWTLRARFDEPGFLSGDEMRRLLTDDRRFHELFGPSQKSLLMPTTKGIRVRTKEGNLSSSHVDHTLASLAEVGTSLAFPVETPAGHSTFRAIVEQGLRDFSLNQVEYEWSSLTFALYLDAAAAWTTAEGQRLSFDVVARRIMRERLPRGVCFGNHRLYTLAALLRIDEQQPIFSPEVRAACLSWLKRATAMLVWNQHAEGYWGDDWARFEGEPTETVDSSGDVATDRILATGHALEWWAIVPEECHPPRGILIRAGQWLVRTIDQLTPQQTQDRFTYLSHAGRALALWRGKTPPQVDVRPATDDTATE
jgi:hypothetical protein